MRFFWLSSKRMTVGVETNKGIIITSAPIVKKFKGQHLSNLIRWMKKQGGLRSKEIT